MTITEAAEGHANSLEGITVRLNHAERHNRIMRECLEYIHEQLEIHRSMAIQGVLFRIEKDLEKTNA